MGRQLVYSEQAILNDAYDPATGTLKTGGGFNPDTSFNNPGKLFTAATTAQTVKVTVPSKAMYLTDISISVDAAMWVQLQDDSTDPLILVPKKYLPANSVWTKQYRTPKKVAVGKALNLLCSVSSGNVSVEVDGYAI